MFSFRPLNTQNVKVVKGEKSVREQQRVLISLKEEQYVVLIEILQMSIIKTPARRWGSPPCLWSLVGRSPRTICTLSLFLEDFLGQFEWMVNYQERSGK
jgi:hypothetical protein